MNNERSLSEKITEGFKALETMRNNEPVAWMDKRTSKCVVFINTPPSNDWTPLYTHPAKTLTDEEIESWITEWAKDLYGTLYVEPTDHQRTMAIKMARAILKKASDNKRDELTREQIVLWAYEAGFPTNYARGEITRFETFARLVQKYLERDYK
jgi:hypothetical protein